MISDFLARLLKIILIVSSIMRGVRWVSRLWRLFVFPETDTPPAAKPVHIGYYSFSTFNYDGAEPQTLIHAEGLAGDVLNFPLHGGGQYRMRGGWIFDISGAGGGQTAERGADTISASGGHGFASIAYPVTFLGIIRVYPLLGIGGGGLRAVMQNPLEQPKTLLDFGGATTQIGVGVEVLLGGKRGLMLGVHMGYQYAIAGSISKIPFMRLHMGAGRLHTIQPPSASDESTPHDNA